ncbi:MAG: protein phosphatase 2C domain-containing protein [Clostridia bacterium]|nr:protein phosphatase 2C domain-containing protein [Clostridia bacterium]
MLGEIMVIHMAVVPDNGEDSFAVSSLPGNVMLCVADGCGGLGSKRYDKLDHRTGAYLASRLAARTMLNWTTDRTSVPWLPQDGFYQLLDLQLEVEATFDGFAKTHCQEESSCRIVGSMQRTLPTTLCALLADEKNAACSFVWAGDSRGYTLDADGLHQYTKDDVRGHADAMDSLLLDRPLSNLICAGQPVKLHMRRFAMPQKGLLFCMTDGVYHGASSPMELEMLLLDTMQHSANQDRWQRKLEKMLAAVMQDDMTLLCCSCGFADYDEMKLYYQPRFEQLKQEYITPVRRKRGNREVARILWERYKEHYDRTEGMADDQQDWRI